MSNQGVSPSREGVPEVDAGRRVVTRGSGDRQGAPGGAGTAVVVAWWSSDKLLAYDETVPQIVRACEQSGGVANQGGRYRRQMPSEGLLAGVLGVDRERLEVRK